MLSNQMYQVLSCFPRNLGQPINYETLLEKCSLPRNDIMECLNETLFPAWNYIRPSNGWRSGSKLYLTESGLAKVEEHEQSCENNRLAAESQSVARKAMWAAFASAVLAGLTLLPDLIALIKWFVFAQ